MFPELVDGEEDVTTYTHTNMANWKLKPPSTNSPIYPWGAELKLETHPSGSIKSIEISTASDIPFEYMIHLKGLEEIRMWDFTTSSHTLFDTIFQLENLTHVTLENVLAAQRAIPASIGRLSKLESITLEDCQLQGQIPDVFQNPKLKEFNVSMNPGLTGTIPPSLLNLPKIESINVKFCKGLSGYIPFAKRDIVNIQSTNITVRPEKRKVEDEEGGEGGGASKDEDEDKRARF